MKFRKPTLYKKRISRNKRIKTRNKRIKTRRRMRLYRGGEGEFDNIKSQIKDAITEIEPLVIEYEQYITRHKALEKLHDKYNLNKKDITDIRYNSPYYNKIVSAVTLQSSAARVSNIRNKQTKLESEMTEIEKEQKARVKQLSVIDNLLPQLERLLGYAYKEVKELDPSHDDHKYVTDTSEKVEAYKRRVIFVKDKIERLPYIEPISNILERAKKPFYDLDTIANNELTRTGMYGNIPSVIEDNAESEVPKAAESEAESEVPKAAESEAAAARAAARAAEAERAKLNQYDFRGQAQGEGLMLRHF